jgi:Ala-tRNA(Pro) deacylase
VSSEQSLLKSLDATGIEWTMHEHEAVFTVEQSAKLHDEIPGMHTKNLFLKDASGQFWVVTVPHNASVDLKGLAIAIGAKKVSFGKPEDMTSLLV